MTTQDLTLANRLWWAAPEASVCGDLRTYTNISTKTLATIEQKIKDGAVREKDAEIAALRQRADRLREATKEMVDAATQFVEEIGNLSDREMSEKLGRPVHGLALAARAVTTGWAIDAYDADAPAEDGEITERIHDPWDHLKASEKIVVPRFALALAVRDLPKGVVRKAFRDALGAQDDLAPAEDVPESVQPDADEGEPTLLGNPIRTQQVKFNITDRREGRLIPYEEEDAPESVDDVLAGIPKATSIADCVQAAFAEDAPKRGEAMRREAKSSVQPDHSLDLSSPPPPTTWHAPAEDAPNPVQPDAEPINPLAVYKRLDDHERRLKRIDEGLENHILFHGEDPALDRFAEVDNWLIQQVKAVQREVRELKERRDATPKIAVTDEMVRVFYDEMGWDCKSSRDLEDVRAAMEAALAMAGEAPPEPVTVTDEMVRAALNAGYKAGKNVALDVWAEKAQENMRDALTAALAVAGEGE